MSYKNLHNIKRTFIKKNGNLINKIETLNQQNTHLSSKLDKLHQEKNDRIKDYLKLIVPVLSVLTTFVAIIFNFLTFNAENDRYMEELRRDKINTYLTDITGFLDSENQIISSLNYKFEYLDSVLSENEKITLSNTFTSMFLQDIDLQDNLHTSYMQSIVNNWPDMRGYLSNESDICKSITKKAFIALFHLKNSNEATFTGIDYPSNSSNLKYEPDSPIETVVLYNHIGSLINLSIDLLNIYTEKIDLNSTAAGNVAPFSSAIENIFPAPSNIKDFYLIKLKKAELFY